MKKFLFLISATILLTLFSCEKQLSLQCEIDNTFILVYKNYREYVVMLDVNNQYYAVPKDSSLTLTVPVIFSDRIYVWTLNGEKVSKMIGRPSCCATYNYYW